MESQEVTYKVTLLEQLTDAQGYTTYVFEREQFNSLDDQYIMCVRFPNWNNGSIDKGDVGFLTVRYVRAGIDTWYNGTDFTPYNYTNIIFLKFLPLKEKVKLTEILVD